MYKRLYIYIYIYRYIDIGRERCLYLLYQDLPGTELRRHQTRDLREHSTSARRARRGNLQCLTKPGPYAGPSAGAEVAHLQKRHGRCILGIRTHAYVASARARGQGEYKAARVRHAPRTRTTIYVMMCFEQCQEISKHVVMYPGPSTPRWDLFRRDCVTSALARRKDPPLGAAQPRLRSYYHYYVVIIIIIIMHT